jgi:DNA-binding transcriptional LysR family regulator
LIEAIVVINHSDIYRIDLNLLVVLDAVHAERNVTRAARRLNIGQPAVSAALRRLRELVGDDLFVKRPGGVAATPRCEQMIGPVREILLGVQDLLVTERAFDITQLERVFTMGVNDSFEELWIPEITRLLSERAPNIDLQIYEAHADSVVPLMDAGHVDLAIGAYPEGGRAHRRRFLYEEHPVCVFDAERLGTLALTLEDYLTAPHVVGSSRGRRSNVVDETLKRMGYRRRVLMSTPHYSAIPYYLKTLSCVATLPARVAEQYGRMFGLAVCDVPIDLPGNAVYAVWHTSHDRDALHRWMRELVVEVMK